MEIIMNHSLWCSSGPSASLTVLLVLGTLSAASAQTYRIETLPPPVTTGDSVGFGLNDNGVVVGWGLTSSGSYRAARWDSVAPFDMGALPAYSASKASGISNNSQIVG